MTQSLKTTAYIFLLILVLPRCKDSYVSPYVNPPTGYLVVEGYITGNGPTRFMLTRTVPLPATSNPPVETKAKLQVEGDNGTTYVLNEQGNGAYGIDTLPLDPAVKYRLRIHTNNNRDYLSDYAPFKITPAIDSISWKADGDNLNIYANAHDASNGTRYYQWQYDETWLYHAAEPSAGVYTEPPPAIETRTYDQQIFDCWKSWSSTGILLGTSAKLSQDVIFLHLINKIPGNSQQLGDMYSTLVRQYALSEDAFNYLTLMQKNSESLGSIFDAQPTQLKGNIHSQTDPTEQILGFVSAGTVQQTRIFIARSQLPLSWHYGYGCQFADTLVPPAAYQYFFNPSGGYIPVSPHFNRGIFDGWLGNVPSCLDCRTQGGVNKKPSYWPN